MRPDWVGYHRSKPMDLRLLPYLPERYVYRLLGVPPSADRAAIVAACRRLSRTFHPDRSASPRANDSARPDATANDSQAGVIGSAVGPAAAEGGAIGRALAGTN